MTTPVDRLAEALKDRYTIERELGAGGMATVYLAHDLKHDRNVAIKVLRPELAAVLGAERFVQEIRTTANLQHPNILPLFDSGEADGFLYYVMPYVEGETLRDKLNRETQLGVEEAVKLTTEVADALDYAHHQNVIHRDIKPENILLHAGRPLVADFGIALAVSAAAGGRMTETGLSLGTPHYMSPEQATADKHVTARSDIYSLGAVLYEMLTGDPPHTGSSAQAIILKIVSEEVAPVTRLRKAVPEHVAAAVAVALEKLPADRFASAAAFGSALTHPEQAPPRAAASPGTGAGRKRGPERRTLVLVVLALVVGSVLGAGLRGRMGRNAGTPTIYDVGLPDSAPIAYTAGSPWGEGWTALDVSPAGDFVVYVALRGGGTELWYRSLTDTVARPIPGTAGAYQPMLSPDGKSVAYFAGSYLMVAPVAGGTPVPVAGVDRPFGGQWATMSQLIVSDSNGVVVMSFDPAARSGGVVRRGGRCAVPRLFAGGEVICSIGAVRRLGDAASRMFHVAVREQVGVSTRLAGSQFTAMDESSLVFLTLDGSLAGVSVDWATLATSRPVPLVGGVRREGFSAAGQFALSRSGMLVYAPGQNAEVGRFARIGEGTLPQELAIPAGAYHRFDLSPDGRRLVAMMQGLTTQELWVYDVASGRGERLLTAPYVGEPRWSPDGTRVMVMITPEEGQPSVTVVVATGSSTPPDTVLGGTAAVNVFSFAADGAVLGVAEDTVLGPVRVDLRTSPPGVRPISRFAGFAQELSPDGRWLAYNSSGASGWEAFVEPFPADGTRYKISPGGGLEPQWRGNTELIYRSGSTWYSVRIEAGAANPVGEPRTIFSDPRFLDTSGRSNDVAPDGSVVYVRGTSETTGHFLRVIPDFAGQLRARLKARGS